MFLLLSGRHAGIRVVVFFLGMITGAHAYATSDSLYYRARQNELIRTGDSLFLYKDDYEEAGKYYLQALRKFQNSNESLAALSRTKLGNVYTSLEKYDRALSYFNQVKLLIDRQNNPDKYLLEQYELYFGKYLLRQVDLDSAAFYIDRSIDLIREYIPEDSLGLAEALFFRAEIFDDQSKHSEAEELYREIEDIYNELLEEDHILFGRLYSYMCRCLRYQLDYTNALDYISKAISIFRKDSLNNLNRLTVATFYLTGIYAKQKKYEESIPPLESVLKMIQNNEDLERFYTYYYTNLIGAYIQTGRKEKARKYIDAYYKYVTSDGPISQEDEAYYYFLKGTYHLALRNYGPAKEFLQKSDELFKMQVAISADHIPCLLALGDLYLETNMLDSALQYYQYALIINSGDFTDKNIYANPATRDNPDQRDVFEIMYKKSRAFRKFYDLTGDIRYLKEALHIYTMIDKLNDEARNSNLRDASLLILNDYFHQEYERAIDCAFVLYSDTGQKDYLDTAFRLMEKNKSMLLFKSLTLAERSRSINLPYSIKRHEDSLRMLNLEFEQKIQAEQSQNQPDQDKIDDLENRKFKITQDLYNLKYRIAAEYPAYYQIRYDSIVKGLSDLERYCDNKKRLGIEYFWGDSNIYKVVTDGQHTGIYRQQQHQQTRESLKVLLDQLSREIDLDSLIPDYKKFNRNAYAIFNQLLGNVTDGEFDNIDRLLIIPDGSLAQLPFEALITKPGDTSYVDYSKLPYLIRETSIEYAYSINLLLNGDKGKTEPVKNLLAFSYSSRDVMAENNNRLESGIELPHTAEELNAIRKVFPGKNKFLYDELATEHGFKMNAPDYKILHLAVHGVADTENGDNSRLIFKHGRDSIDDSNLYIYELYGMDLNKTRLAVLSACETGIGKEFRGEGVFSMARGFTYAGCPTVIMSLWPIMDEYSATIMSDFYRLLKKGKPASDALRDAKLDFIKQQDELGTHPVNWASFVYLGEEYVYRSGPNLLFVVAIPVLFLIIGFLVYFFRYRSS